MSADAEATFRQFTNADGTLQCARVPEVCIRLGAGHPVIERELTERVDELLKPLGKSARALDSLTWDEFVGVLAGVRGWLPRAAADGLFAAALGPRAAGGPTALQAAVHSGDSSAVSAVLLLGADANAPFADGMLPLYLAAQRGHAGVASVLVREGGAQPDALSKVGATALAVACWKGRAAVAACLLELRASPNAQSRDGSTALSMAAKGGHAAVIVELLRGTGHPAYGGSHAGRAAAGAEPLDLELPTSKGHTPLLRAAHGGHLAVVSLLLEAAADPNGTDLEGLSPLCAAVAAGSVGVCRALIGAQADADQATFKGSAPLLIAVERRSAELVQLLLTEGAAEADVASRTGLSALWYAQSSGQPVVANLLLEAGARLDHALADGGNLLAAW